MSDTDDRNGTELLSCLDNDDERVGRTNNNVGAAGLIRENP